MPWTALWSYVSHFEVGLSLLLGLPGLVFYRKFYRNRRFRPTATVNSGHQQRRSRRGHRRPLTQPSRVHGAGTPEKLAKSMRCCGRVPSPRREPAGPASAPVAPGAGSLSLAAGPAGVDGAPKTSTRRECRPVEWRALWLHRSGCCLH